MDYTPLDSLPYIDADITEEERDEIEKLIMAELQGQDTASIHPKVEELYPLPEPSSLISGISQTDAESENFTLTGIDLDKYSSLEDPESLQKSVAYTYLRNNSLKLGHQFGKNQWLIANEETSQVNQMIEDEISRKKRRIQEVNAERKQVQEEVKPTLDYLKGRWTRSVQNNVDLGVEILKIKHGVPEE